MEIFTLLETLEDILENSKNLPFTNKGMVEKDAYCPDILVQSAAVNAAINAFNKELLANHIKGCVVRDLKDGKDEVIDELVVTLQKLMK